VLANFKETILDVMELKQVEVLLDPLAIQKECVDDVKKNLMSVSGPVHVVIQKLECGEGHSDDNEEVSFQRFSSMLTIFFDVHIFALSN
jgi:hypothetical protein